MTSRALPDSLVVSVEFPLVFLVPLVKSLELPAEILLLSLQPGVVGREGGEDQMSPGHLAVTQWSNLIGPDLDQILYYDWWNFLC